MQFLCKLKQFKDIENNFKNIENLKKKCKNIRILFKFFRLIRKPNSFSFLKAIGQVVKISKLQAKVS